MKIVLIVEDDKNIARAMGVRLGAHGYRVTHAYDAITALMVAKNTEPDLVVLDISMPGGDGFVVAERLRQWKGDAIPIIFVTASQKPGLVERAETLDAACFLQKPFSGQEFVATVAAAI